MKHYAITFALSQLHFWLIIHWYQTSFTSSCINFVSTWLYIRKYWTLSLDTCIDKFSPLSIFSFHFNQLFWCFTFLNISLPVICIANKDLFLLLCIHTSLMLFNLFLFWGYQFNLCVFKGNWINVSLTVIYLINYKLISHYH